MRWWVRYLMVLFLMCMMLMATVILDALHAFPGIHFLAWLSSATLTITIFVYPPAHYIHRYLYSDYD